MQTTHSLPAAETAQIKDFWTGIIPVHSIIVSLVILVGLLVIRHLLIRTTVRDVTDAKIRKIRKRRVSLVVGISALILLLPVWLPTLQNFAAVLGIFGAGIILIFREILVSISGWLYLLVRRPYRAGDFIQIGPSFGEVSEIRLLGTVIAETRAQDFVETGKRVYIPNSKVLTETITNSGDMRNGFPLEIQAIFDADSDVEFAIRAMLNEARNLSPEATVEMDIKGKAVIVRLSLLVQEDTPRNSLTELQRSIWKKFHKNKKIRFCDLK